MEAPMKTLKRLVLLAIFSLVTGNGRAADTAPLPVALPDVVSEGPACADGKCVAAKKKHDGSCCDKLWNWLTYKAPKAPCDCHRTTAYRPPLYAWFPCKPEQCHSGHCLKMPEDNKPLAKGKHFDEPLPMPQMPNVIVVRPTQPLVSPVSSALAVPTDEPGNAPSNYKALQIAVPQGKK